MIANYIFNSFERLKLSNSIRFVLRKLAITNIQDLVKYSSEELQDILEVQQLDKYTADFLAFYQEIISDIFSPSLLFRNREGLLCYDLKIEYFSLPTRLYNIFKKMNINTLSEIVDINSELIKQYSGTGQKKITEFLNKKNLYLVIEDRLVKDYEYDDLSKACLQIIAELRLRKDINGAEIFTILYTNLQETRDFVFDGDFFTHKDFFIKVAHMDAISTILADFILELIHKNEIGISSNELLFYMPRGFNVLAILDDILMKLTNKRVIYLDETRYKIKHISILEFVASLEKESDKKILSSRLQGNTLETIGTEMNLTRERVRQIVKKILAKRPTVLEDHYKMLYTQYHFTKEQFLIAFATGDYVYTYLSLCYSQGKQDIKACFNDPRIAPKELRGIEKAIYKDYYFIGNEYVKSQRSDLCEYIIRTFAIEEISYEQFVEYYYLLIANLGLKNKEKYSLKGRGYENKMIMSDYVLWKYGRKLRYYNLHAYDFSELLTTLDLQHYKDSEISTLLLFRKYPELMDMYDIRDEYELHNLLKKVLKNSEENIKFLRMPHLEIGNTNREKQVWDLLVLHAPIKKVELAEKYEEVYGATANTVLANYFKEIALYFHDGSYNLDNPLPPSEVLNILSSILTDDFYTIKSVKKVVLSKLPNLEMKFVNPYVLKTIGFRIYTTYIIKDVYLSASSYFKYLLTNNADFCLEDFSRDIVNLVGFQSEFAKLKREYEILEYQSVNYINFSQLRKKGITKHDLYDYCELVAKCIEKNHYFTIHSLMKQGIKQESLDIGYGDLFYASILSECKSKFRFRRVGNTKLFLKGTKIVLIGDFLEYVLFEKAIFSINIEDLITILKEHYAIFMEKYRIKEIVKETTLYYDSIADVIYLDYDTYCAEVKQTSVQNSLVSSLS